MTLGHGGMRKLAASLAVSLVLVGCATRPPPAEGPETWAGHPFGAAPEPNPALRQALIARAEQEWQFFGRQTVVLQGQRGEHPTRGRMGRRGRDL